jgi:eukaryotic-like serine/threonine-protein kinase
MTPSTHSTAGPSCPTQAELAAFYGGRLPPETSAAVGTHLSGCGACEAALEHIAEESDTFARFLRRPPGGVRANPFEEDPEYRRMERRAREAGGAAPAPEPSTLPLARPPAPGASLALPARLGPYEVREEIGKGGMGKVYRAFHVRLKKWVALKVVRPDLVGQPQVLARFEREMEAVGRLDHPNVVRALDAGEEGGVHYLAMEWVDGTDLRELVSRRGRLPVAEACELVRQAAAALQAAHQQQLVHRDVKPSNLLLSRQGQVKLLDLGLALLSRGEETAEALTESSQLLGTWDYMAPEQWESGHTVDIRADLYSLGCTLYTLLTGKPPFRGPEFDSLHKKMAAHLHAIPTPVRRLRPEVPEALAGVLARLLAKDPAGRYQVPQEVARALEPFAAGADLEELAVRLQPAAAAEVTPEGGGTPTAPAPGGKWRRWLVAASVVLALLAGGAAFVTFVVLPRRPGAEPADPHDLLARPPAVLVWPEQGEDNRWEHDPKKRQLRVDCSDIGLFQLAEVDAEGFELEVTVFQNPWVGGVGVFFRDREEVANEEVVRCADTVLFGHFAAAGDAPVNLARGLMKRFPARRREHHDWERQVSFPHPGPGEHKLRITVGRAGLRRIAWDDKPVASELHDPLGGASRSGAWGGVGVIVQASNARFSGARLTLNPPSEGQP